MREPKQLCARPIVFCSYSVWIRVSSSSICATCCSALNAARTALTALWVTPSGPAHVVSFRERAGELERYKATRRRRSVGRSGRFHRRRRERERDRGRERRRARRGGTHAHSLAKVGAREGRVGLPCPTAHLPTLLPTIPCPYCPWRSSNHLSRRSTFGLVSRVPPPPFHEASF